MGPVWNVPVFFPPSGFDSSAATLRSDGVLLFISAAGPRFGPPPLSLPTTKRLLSVKSNAPKLLRWPDSDPLSTAPSPPLSCGVTASLPPPSTPPDVRCERGLNRRGLSGHACETVASRGWGRVEVVLASYSASCRRLGPVLSFVALRECVGTLQLRPLNGFTGAMLGSRWRFGFFLSCFWRITTSALDFCPICSPLTWPPCV